MRGRHDATDRVVEAGRHGRAHGHAAAGARNTYEKKTKPAEQLKRPAGQVIWKARRTGRAGLSHGIRPGLKNAASRLPLVPLHQAMKLFISAVARTQRASLSSEVRSHGACLLLPLRKGRAPAA
jgi:hypothetical protein